MRKGSKLYIQGSIRTRKWQDQSGVDKYTTEIIANDMQMLDRRGDMDNAPYGGDQQSQSVKSPSTMDPSPLVSDVEGHSFRGALLNSALYIVNPTYSI